LAGKDAPCANLRFIRMQRYAGTASTNLKIIENKRGENGNKETCEGYV